jgi:hypothetical protein
MDNGEETPKITMKACDVFIEIPNSTKSTPVVDPTNNGSTFKAVRTPSPEHQRLREIAKYLSNCLTLAQQVKSTDTKALIALLEQARNAIPKGDV